MANFAFTYPSVSESEETMLDDITACLKQHGIADATFQRILLAVSEAFTNALTHANGHDPKKKIKIRMSINERFVSADIIDEGQGGMPRIKKHTSPGLLADHGRGLELIKHYASQVEFFETDQGGIRTNIVFNLREKQSTI